MEITLKVSSKLLIAASACYQPEISPLTAYYQRRNASIMSTNNSALADYGKGHNI
jgi:hypothetical protein